MKKFIIPVLALLALASCTAKFDEMNKPTTGLTAESAQPMYIFGRTLYNGSSNDHQRNFNLNDDMYAHYFADGLVGPTTGVTTPVGVIFTGVTSIPIVSRNTGLSTKSPRVRICTPASVPPMTSGT